MNAQFKKGVLELCVLAQLIHEDKYGYELTEAISNKMTIAAGTLYLILKRLTDEGYFECNGGMCCYGVYCCGSAW